MSLVCCKLLCAVAAPQEYETVTAVFDCGGKQFTAKGKTILTAGWKDIDARFRAALKAKPEEDGAAFTETARIKARAVMEATKLPAIADDSGLCVDALNGGPGVYSARFGGEGLDDTGRYRLLLQMMHGQADRRAHFHTTITCAFPNGDVLQDDGEVEGTIAFAPMGENGFGYDPVFFMPDKRKTFAQLTAEEKAEISHRGKALRAFKETLKNYLAEHQ